MKYGVIAVLFLAAILRFHQIETRSLWEDEGWTLVLIETNNPSGLMQNIAFDQHTPLYFFAIRGWVGLAGYSEFALRALSAFMGILSVALLFQVGKTAFNPKVGLFAAGLLAVWDFPIDLAQDARQYSQLLLLTLLSVWFFLRFCQNPSRSNGLNWWLWSVAALYTQYMAGVILLIQLLFALLSLRPWQKLGDFCLRWGLICAAFVPWLPVFIHQNQVRWLDPIYYQSGLPNNSATFVLIRDALLTQQFGLVVGLILLGWVSWKIPPPTLFLLLWGGLYVGLIVWLNQSREILRIRLFILAIPPLLLLLALGLDRLPPFPQTFLMAVLVLSNLATVDSRQTHAPWREVVANVRAWHLGDEPVLMDIWVGDFPARYYVGDDMPWLSLRELRRQAGDYFLPELVAYVDQEDAFWLLRWNDDPTEYDDLLAGMGFQRTLSPYVLHETNRLYSHRYDRLGQESIAIFGQQITLLKASLQDNLTLNLWWLTTEALALDYSVSVFASNPQGQIVAQQDRSPLLPTSQWQAQAIQFDQHRLALAPGKYEIGLRVYWYAEPDQPLLTQDGAGFVTIETIEIQD